MNYLISSTQPTTWYYLGLGIFITLLAATLIFLIWKMKRSPELAKPRRDFWQSIKTALWACTIAELLVLLSIWLGLPMFGKRSTALVVAGLFGLWLIAIFIYHLFFYPAKFRKTQRAQVYTKYIPS